MKMTYEELAQAIADEVNEDIRFNNNLSDGDVYNDTVLDRVIMDKSSSLCPDYLDHYDVADIARGMVDITW